MKPAENSSTPQLSQRISLRQGLRQRYILTGISVLLLCSACFLYYMLQQPEVNAEPGTKEHTTMAVTAAPVNMTSEITVEDNVPVLKWEGNFPQGSIFLLERSADGVEWETIQSVPKEEVMVAPNKYSFNDAEANGSDMHYRLTCLDAKNQILTTEEMQASMTARPEQLLTITAIEPLPFGNQFTVNFEADMAEPISFEIINNDSQQVYAEVYTVKKGENLIGFTRGEKLPPGIYIIRLSGSDNAIAMTKVIKQ